jgi:threonine dehydratase
MPVIAPIMKVENCKKYGATVVSFGQNLAESKEKALQIAKEKDFLYINGYVITEILDALIFYRLKMFCSCPCRRTRH